MIKDGLLSNAIYISSPHYNLRPMNAIIDLLVIHCASLPEGEFANNNIEKLFCGTMAIHEQKELGLSGDLKVSSHVYIKRCGEIIQFVNFNKRAWHAGQSSFEGKENCNDYSVGIELQGTVNENFTDEQYVSLINVTKNILNYYPQISKGRIIGHADIAPVRKADPGEFFDWQYYLKHI